MFIPICRQGFFLLLFHSFFYVDIPTKRARLQAIPVNQRFGRVAINPLCFFFTSFFFFARPPMELAAFCVPLIRPCGKINKMNIAKVKTGGGFSNLTARRCVVDRGGAVAAEKTRRVS